MSVEEPQMRRYLRFSRYIPVACTVLNTDRPPSQPLDGITRKVNAGGLEILLREALPVKTRVSVQVAGSDPISGHIVSVGEVVPTILGERFPHGLAFEKAVDAALVRKWVSQPHRRSAPRAAVQFAVEFKQEARTASGTCLNMCKGGMFIATPRPVVPGKEVLLSFTLPGHSDPFLVRAQIVWMAGGEQDPAVTTGMGVKFLDLDPSEASAIGALVDNLCAEAAASKPADLLPPSK